MQRSAWVSAECTVIDSCPFMLVLIHCLLVHWWQFGYSGNVIVGHSTKLLCVEPG